MSWPFCVERQKSVYTGASDFQLSYEKSLSRGGLLLRLPPLKSPDLRLMKYWFTKEVVLII